MPLSNPWVCEYLEMMAEFFSSTSNMLSFVLGSDVCFAKSQMGAEYLPVEFQAAYCH